MAYPISVKSVRWPSATPYEKLEAARVAVDRLYGLRADVSYNIIASTAVRELAKLHRRATANVIHEFLVSHLTIEEREYIGLPPGTKANNGTGIRWYKKDGTPNRLGR